ncbi:MAG: hypothetical protein U9N41_07995 [Euryarchaeota archaeon]|nr:hypothetical protein [Euryarchaeota archaeon]
MRLFVECHHCHRRIYLGITAEGRNELIQRLGSSDFEVECPHCNYSDTYSVNEVFAVESNVLPAGAIIGGLIGLLGGPIGLIIGSSAGALLGASADAEDQRKARLFNES